jgi:hypothetical protein
VRVRYFAPAAGVGDTAHLIGSSYGDICLDNLASVNLGELMYVGHGVITSTDWHLTQRLLIHAGLREIGSGEVAQERTRWPVEGLFPASNQYPSDSMYPYGYVITVHIDADTPAVPATAVGRALAPNFIGSLSRTVVVPAAVVTGRAPVPGLIIGGGAIVSAVSAVAAGRAGPVNNIISVVVNVPAASATGKAPAPS